MDKNKAYVCIYSNNISCYKMAQINKLEGDQVLREEAVGAQWMDRHTDEQSNLLRCRLAQKKEEKPGKTSRDKKSCSDWQYNL